MRWSNSGVLAALITIITRLTTSKKEGPPRALSEEEEDQDLPEVTTKGRTPFEPPDESAPTSPRDPQRLQEHLGFTARLLIDQWNRQGYKAWATLVAQEGFVETLKKVIEVLGAHPEGYPQQALGIALDMHRRQNPCPAGPEALPNWYPMRDQPDPRNA